MAWDERRSPGTRRRPPRVLRIITRLNVGGPARHVLLADSGLRERGWETLLVHGEIDVGEAELRIASEVPMVRLSSLGRPIRPPADARALASLVRIIRRYRPDIIHTHLSKAGLLGRVAGLLARPAARRVHTFHGTLFGNYFGEGATRAIVRAERFLGRRTDRVLALSAAQRQELLDHEIAPADRIGIVPLGLDLSRFGGLERREARERLGISDERPVLVAAGRMVPIKRLDRLVDVMAIVRRTLPARLYLIGDGPEREALEAQVRRLGLQDDVSFVGWVEEVADWYAAADAVLLTSDREGTPLALIEAAAAARPVVATDVGGVADVVVDGETGFVVPPDDVGRFAERVVFILTDSPAALRIGGAAPAQAKRFAAARLVDDLELVYTQLLRPGA